MHPPCSFKIDQKYSTEGGQYKINRFWCWFHSDSLIMELVIVIKICWLIIYRQLYKEDKERNSSTMVAKYMLHIQTTVNKSFCTLGPLVRSYC